jgi:hypothetical protein
LQSSFEEPAQFKTHSELQSWQDFAGEFTVNVRLGQLDKQVDWYFAEAEGHVTHCQSNKQQQQKELN